MGKDFVIELGGVEVDEEVVWMRTEKGGGLVLQARDPMVLILLN